MKKEILKNTFLALILCMAVIIARPVMAAAECTSETCKDTCKTGGCNVGDCDATCCPVQVGEKCYPTLQDAVNAAENGTVELRTDLELTDNVQVTKTVTIDGKGHKIKASASWNGTGADKSLITATGDSGKLTLKDVILEDSKAYGAQAYGGATLILDNVTVNNCNNGAIHANGGTVIVHKLTLGHNGKYWNIGIEVSNGKDVKPDPKIIMDGEIITDEKSNVIYSPMDGTATDFKVENTENSKQKVYSEGNKVYIVDETGTVLFESKINRR